MLVVFNRPAKMKILLILGKTLEKQKLNFSRSALFHMKTGVSLKYFVNDCKMRSNCLYRFDSNCMKDSWVLMYFSLHVKKLNVTNFI